MSIRCRQRQNKRGAQAGRGACPRAARGDSQVTFAHADLAAGTGRFVYLVIHEQGRKTRGAERRREALLRVLDGYRPLERGLHA